MANSINQTKKAKYTKKTNTEGVYDLYHFETDDKQVLLDEDVGDIAAGTTLHDALTTIKKNADTGGQAATDLATHIKNKENPHGVTKGQVGLGSVVNAGMDATPTSGSNNYVKSDGVYTAVSEAKSAASAAQSKADSAYSLASGRSNSFVFSDVTKLRSGTPSGGKSISECRIGDNIYVVATGVSDFWISDISPIEKIVSTVDTISSAKEGASVNVKWGSSYVTLVAVENKIDLSGYATSTNLSDAKKAVIAELHEDINIPSANMIKPLDLFNGDVSLDTLYAGYDLGSFELYHKPEWPVREGIEDRQAIKLWNLIIAPGQGSDDNIGVLMHECEFTYGQGWTGTTVFTLSYNDEKYTFQLTATMRPESVDQVLFDVTFVDIFVRLLTQNITPALRSTRTTLQGDVSATFTNAGGTVNATLADSGVTEGTYSCVHVDAKGRVTRGALSLVFASSLDDTESLDNLAVGGVAIIG